MRVPKRVGTVVLIAGALLSLAAWQALRPPLTFFPPGKTNGYVILIQAALALTGPAPSTLTNNFQQAVTLNQPSLNLMRQAFGFDAECPQHLYSAPRQIVMDLRALQELSILAKIEGDLFVEKGDWKSAADSYLGIIRLGHQIEHGPRVSLHWGLSVQANGVAGLSNVASRLRPKERAAVVRTLRELFTDRVTMAQVEARERYRINQFAAQYPPYQSLLLQIVAPAAPFFSENRAARKKLESRLQQSQSELNQLIHHLSDGEPGSLAP